MNLEWAFALLDGLASQGAQRAVISPGSRSTPLALACDGHPLIRTWVQVDERCAGFFALGLARCDLKPVILIATSGSAPCHWYPAVIEASGQHLPLVLISADRPPELQGWHANQTTEQTRLFGPHVRGFHCPGLPEPGPDALRSVRASGARAARQAQWPQPGPVHINQPFREPLMPRPDAIGFPSPSDRPSPQTTPRILPDGDQVQRILTQISGQPGLIVCGDGCRESGAAEAISTLARTLACPVFADPLSDLRFGRHVHAGILSRYDAFLRNPRWRDSHRPGWILRFGTPPVSKALLDCLGSWRDAASILIAPEGDWPDPLHTTSELVQASAVELCQALRAGNPSPVPPDWSRIFEQAERHAGRTSLRGCDDDLPFEGDLIEDLLQALVPDSLLFCGNSMPIRQLDTWSGTATKPLRLVGSRGVSGIDGQVSTLLGLAANPGTGPVVGLLGDLALYHDMNGLLASPGLDAVIIVLNNGGGGIFGYLSQSGLAQFERYWLTPTGLNLRRVADLYGLGFQRVDRQSAFLPAFVRAVGEPGVSLIEVMIDRRHSMDRHHAYWDAVLQDAG